MALGEDLTVEQAMDALDEARTLLVAALGRDDLCRVGDERLLGFMARLERFRSALTVVDQAIVEACDTTELAHRLQLRSTARLLSEAVRIDEIEARRRVRAAEALRGRTTMLGEPLPAHRPILAAAVSAGRVTPDQADRALHCLTRLDRLPWTTPEQVTEAERVLTESAERFAPRDFKQIVDRVSEAINPDGVLSDDQMAEASRGIILWQGRDGRYHVKGDLTPMLYQRMRAALDPLAAPQSGPDGDDLRRPEQRMHDAFDDAFGRLLRSDGLSDAGGTPTTVIVTIDHDSLLSGTGFGRLADGHPIAVQTLLQEAQQAEVIPAVLATSGKVLSLGRSRRIADRNQTAALIARDGGCSFPSCDRPPSWCERHHVRSWLDGGPTDVDNLTLVCSYHHHQFQHQGWACRMINGLPNWIPPRWIDPDQQPMINYRILDRLSAGRGPEPPSSNGSSPGKAKDTPSPMRERVVRPTSRARTPALVPG